MSSHDIGTFPRRTGKVKRGERAPRPKLAELAVSIRAHLKRFELDPVINRKNGEHNLSPYYGVGANSSGNRVLVTYVAYQGHSGLTRTEAERYLVWLDAGNVGRHFEALEAKR
jgi:hypothetical protein